MSSIYTCAWRLFGLIVLGALVSLPVWYTAVCHWSAVYACPSKESNSSWLLSLSLYLEAIKVLLSEEWTDKERSVSAREGKHFSDDHLNMSLKDIKCSGDFSFFLHRILRITHLRSYFYRAQWSSGKLEERVVYEIPTPALFKISHLYGHTRGVSLLFALLRSSPVLDLPVHSRLCHGYARFRSTGQPRK